MSLRLETLNRTVLGIAYGWGEQLKVNHNKKEDRVKNNLRAKLSVKMILLAQYLEEFFINNKNELATSEDFIETLAIFVLIYDCFGLLNFDFPYKSEFTDYMEEVAKYEQPISYQQSRGGK